MEYYRRTALRLSPAAKGSAARGQLGKGPWNLFRGCSDHPPIDRRRPGDGGPFALGRERGDVVDVPEPCPPRKAVRLWPMRVPGSHP